MRGRMHRLEIELQILGGKTTPRQHIGACLKLGAVIFALTLLTWAFFSQGLIVGIAVSLAFATAAFAYHFTSPARQLALEAGKIEKHLPFCLMQLSEELNSGIAMEGALSQEHKERHLGCFRQQQHAGNAAERENTPKMNALNAMELVL